MPFSTSVDSAPSPLSVVWSFSGTNQALLLVSAPFLWTCRIILFFEVIRISVWSASWSLGDFWLWLGNRSGAVFWVCGFCNFRMRIYRGEFIVWFIVYLIYLFLRYLAICLYWGISLSISDSNVQPTNSTPLDFYSPSPSYLFSILFHVYPANSISP